MYNRPYRRMRVPIRVRPSASPRESATSEIVAPVCDAEPAVVDPEQDTRSNEAPRYQGWSKSVAGHSPPQTEESSSEMWRDRALRLRAEMDNFRKRQRRLAEERVTADRERLLRSFLSVADDLERAVAAAHNSDAAGVRQGLEITQQKLMHMLKREGVEPIDAQDQHFDPAWHEAVSVVRRNGADELPQTVADVLEPGYRLGDRLLRPAKVVVAS